MKKILLILAVFSITAVSQVYAFGLGMQGNYYLNFEDNSNNYGQATPNFGFSLLISPSRQLNFAGSYYFIKTTHLIGVTADFIPEAFTFKLAGSEMTLLSNSSAWWLNFSFGVGGFVNVWVINVDKDDMIDEIDFSGGIRIPICFSFNLANGFIEIFASIAPSIGVRFGEATPFADWFFPMALGVRIWIE